MKRLLTTVLLVVLTCGLLAPAEPAAAAEQCFPETGQCISGPIADYWRANGGLAVFGYPISPLRLEQVEMWSGPVQWFERDRLEDHSNEGKGVLAGRLGAQVLEAQERPWQPGTPGPALPECRTFPVTGYTVCPPFITYWEQNGGLARFGYPIGPRTEELLIDPISGIRRPFPVQYFERRRMEEHTEYGDLRVMLGLLGNNVQRHRGCEPADPPYTQLATEVYAEFGCPRWFFPPLVGEIGASQNFENGFMIWVTKIYRRPNQVYAVWNDAGTTRWRQVYEQWNPQEPQPTPETPPAGRLVPERGFGFVWRNYPEIRQALGWATNPEIGISAPVQIMRRGSMFLTGRGTVLLTDQGSYQDGAMQGVGREVPLR
jgi:hypothetical protein